MEIHKIGGGFVKKFFPELCSLNEKGEDVIPTLQVEFPNSLKELSQLARDKNFHFVGKNEKGEILCEKDFPTDEKEICSNEWRGRSLAHQGAQKLTEEQKAEKKAERATKNEVLKEMAAEIEARIAAKNAAKAKNGN